MTVSLSTTVDPAGGQSLEPTRERSPRHRIAVGVVPIFLLQTALALRNQSSISTDEATYVVAGHQVLSNLLFQTPVQDYGTYFSGIPGLYPVLAAGIDQVTGLTGVRIFSLLCMLLVTGCLYTITDRLFGRPAATFASLVFVVSSGATFIAWYATFDAPSLALLAVATALAFGSDLHPGWRRLVAIGIVMVVAAATKYVALEYLPAVAFVVAVRGFQLGGWQRALNRTAIVGAAAAACAGAVIALAAPGDWTGFMATSSSDRKVLNPDSRLDLLGWSWSFIGLWLLLSLLGLVLAFRRQRYRLVGMVLFGTGLLPVGTQVVLGELTSLHKHTTFGFFFAAPLAGCAVASVLSFGRRRISGGGPIDSDAAVSGGSAARRLSRFRTIAEPIAPLVIALWLLTMLGTGMSSAAEMKYGWPEEHAVASALDPYVNSSGNYLADNSSIPNYLFGDRTTPTQWASPWFFEYRNDKVLMTGTPAMEKAVQDHFFTAIVYRPSTFTDAQSEVLLPAIAANYRLLVSVQYTGGVWSIWIPQR